MLLSGVASDGELAHLAQRLRTAVGETPMSAEGKSLRLTISIGAVRAASEHDTFDSLVEAADRCLYAAERQGRDCVSLVPHVLDVEPPAPSVPAACRSTLVAPSGHSQSLS